MKAFLQLLFAPCREITRRTSLSLDRDLPRSHLMAIRIHYVYCTACRRFRRQAALMRHALRRLGDGTLPDDALPDISLPDAARDRLKRFINDR